MSDDIQHQMAALESGSSEYLAVCACQRVIKRICEGSVEVTQIEQNKCFDRIEEANDDGSDRFVPVGVYILSVTVKEKSVTIEEKE